MLKKKENNYLKIISLFTLLKLTGPWDHFRAMSCYNICCYDTWKSRKVKRRCCISTRQRKRIKTTSKPQFATTLDIERALNPIVIHASRQQLHQFTMEQSAIFGSWIIE